MSEQTAETALQNAGVFKGAEGLRGLAECQAFWDEQPYGTRLYFGSGIADYLHRDVLRAAVAALATQPQAPQGAVTDAILKNAKAAIRHWNEFGPEFQFAICMDHLQSSIKDASGPWQPIETAPRDFGVTVFDVWTGSERLADCWWGVPTYPENVRKDHGIVRLDGYDCNGPVVERVKNATHWMPLPAAPETPEGKK